MFVSMEQELLYWKERLEPLEKGKSIILLPTDKTSSIYSAIRSNADLFKGKTFSIRTHPVSLQKRVIRTK